MRMSHVDAVFSHGWTWTDGELQARGRLFILDHGGVFTTWIAREATVKTTLASITSWLSTTLWSAV